MQRGKFKVSIICLVRAYFGVEFGGIKRDGTGKVGRARILGTTEIAWIYRLCRIS